MLLCEYDASLSNLFGADAIGRAQLESVFRDTPESRAAMHSRMADMLAMFEFEVRLSKPVARMAGSALAWGNTRCMESLMRH